MLRETEEGAQLFPAVLLGHQVAPDHNNKDCSLPGGGLWGKMGKIRTTDHRAPLTLTFPRSTEGILGSFAWESRNDNGWESDRPVFKSWLCQVHAG